jgi:hypothetical protein
VIGGHIDISDYTTDTAQEPNDKTRKVVMVYLVRSSQNYLEIDDGMLDTDGVGGGKYIA